MKNKPMYFSFLAVIITALAACFIRFFQFLKYTDAKSGLVVGDDLLTFVLYGVVAVSYTHLTLPTKA